MFADNLYIMLMVFKVHVTSAMTSLFRIQFYIANDIHMLKQRTIAYQNYVLASFLKAKR